jgi:tetratricopeptide (TPR) repeat protein
VLGGPQRQSLLADTGLRQHGLDVLEAERSRCSDAVAGPLGAPISPRMIGAATFFYSLGMYMEAYAAYDLITAVTPGMRSAWLPLGICQLHEGDAEAALRSLIRACDLDRNNALAWLSLGEAHTALGRTENAAAAHERARALRPDLLSQPDPAPQAP